MQRTRLYLLLAAVLMGLVLLGYIWPQKTNLSGPLAERDWQWPSPTNQKEVEPQPKLLARFWPVQESTSIQERGAEADAKAKTKFDIQAQQTMKLVAIVRQGNQQQALVLTPKGKLKTLNVGDLLDKRRTVTAISNTGLTWQTLAESLSTDATNQDNAKDKTHQQSHSGASQQGELTLFPRPTALVEPAVKEEAALIESKAPSEPDAISEVTASEPTALSELTALSQVRAINETVPAIDSAVISDKNAAAM